MIRNLLHRQRIGLGLLILNIFITRVFLFAENNEGKLELPKVVIYGSYTGKIQLGEKKSFYPYISHGKFLMPSKYLPVELKIPLRRIVSEKTQRVSNYWVFFDVSAGNFWSDKLFGNLGIKNKAGFFSLVFNDFRRSGWVKNYSKKSEFIGLKAVFNGEKKYLSGKGFYNYNKDITGSLPVIDTFVTRKTGIEVFSKFYLHPSILSIYARLVQHNYPDRALGGIGSGMRETVGEGLYNFSVKHDISYYRSPLGIYDIKGKLSIEGAKKQISNTDWNSAKTLVYFDIQGRATFQIVGVVTTGIRTFLENGKVYVSPLFSIRTVIPGFEMYPFVSYREERRINTLNVFYSKCPYALTDVSDYTVSKGKSVMVGIEGDFYGASYLFSYNHIEYQNYPVCYMTVIRTEKDILKTNVVFTEKDFDFTFNGEYTPQKRILCEPISRFDVLVDYKGFSPYVFSVGFNSEFAIKTINDNTDIFLLNASVERKVFDSLKMRFEVNNIFDSRYERWEGYKEGGIQFYFSLKYKIAR